MTDFLTIQILSIGHGDESVSALRKYLQPVPDLVLVGEAANPSQALRILRNTHIDVALLDLGMNDSNGIALTKEIRQAYPTVKVLVSTASDSPEDIFAAMDAGADGYVLHGISNNLESAIRSLRLGTVWLDPAIARQVLEVMVTTANVSSARTLPTGIMMMPLMPHEKDLLSEVASSNCVDGVCMVDPNFVRKLRRFAPATTNT